MNRTVERLLALTGTATSVALITITLPEFIITCKLNTIFRKGN
jgi:hypothetical protein